jgi:hypothetical protein
MLGLEFEGMVSKRLVRNLGRWRGMSWEWIESRAYPFVGWFVIAVEEGFDIHVHADAEGGLQWDDTARCQRVKTIEMTSI